MRFARQRRFGAGLLLGTTLVWSLISVGLTAGAEPSFIDSTATLTNRAQISVGSRVFIGPFANVKAGTGTAGAVQIGDESDIQDNTTVDATTGHVALGEMTILAHGATVRGPATLGEHGSCPGGAAICPTFVGFNAEVSGTTIEKDAMVGHLARVGPGVTIPSGRKVLPGKNVSAHSEVATKTAPLVEADREFMKGVIEVNVSFAQGYAELQGEDASNAQGVNYDSGPTTMDSHRDLPSFAGQELRDATFRDRIIGDVNFAQTLPALSAVMGTSVSLRADEGQEWQIGTVAQISDRATWHALENTHLQIGDGGTFGLRSIVHGGPTTYKDMTVTGKNVKLGDGAVFFRSRAGDNVTIGARTLVQQSDLVAGTTVPAKTIYIENQAVGQVEWDESQTAMPGLPNTGAGGGVDGPLTGALALGFLTLLAGGGVLARRRTAR